MIGIMIFANVLIRYREGKRSEVKSLVKKKRNQIRLLENFETGLGVIEKFRRNYTSFIKGVETEMKRIYEGDY